MKILITGSTGFLGKVVIRQIKNKKNLFFITRNNNNNKNNFYCHLENLKKVKRIVNFLKPDVIINLAAEINFIKRTKKMYKVNSFIPKIFAEYCKKHNKHLIQASGILVNGIYSLYNHETRLNPANAYGKTKLIADRYIQKTKCNYSIIRFGGIYGKNGPTHLGINNFIKKAINKKKLIFSGNPNSKRNYIFVNDAAKYIIDCISKKKFGIFYLGGQTQTFKVMIEKINSILGSKKKILFEKNKDLKSDQIIMSDKSFKTTSFLNSLKVIKCA
jgi:nucleoside-diphosphate-sugar epimerase